MTAPTRTAPTLTTGRLTLRPMRAEDFPAYAALMASPRARGMGGPYDAAQAWGLFCHDVAGWTLFGHGALMIERRDTGETVGQVGLNGGPLFDEPELGWMLYDGQEGHGYATEAARALRSWAFTHLPYDTIVSDTDADNAASCAVARRLGAAEDNGGPRKASDRVIFRHRDTP